MVSATAAGQGCDRFTSVHTQHGLGGCGIANLANPPLSMHGSHLQSPSQPAILQVSQEDGISGVRDLLEQPQGETNGREQGEAADLVEERGQAGGLRGGHRSSGKAQPGPGGVLAKLPVRGGPCLPKGLLFLPLPSEQWKSC